MKREKQDTFGNFVQMKRKELGLTQEYVAARLKISEAYYSYIESDARKAPDRDAQDRLADILELTNDERLRLYDLAGQARGTVGADLPEYINSNPYVRVALRKARDTKAGQEHWLRFIAELSNWEAVK